MSWYLQCLHGAVRAMHQCGCVDSGTSRVIEYWEGRKVIEGDIETFSLSGHPVASEAFARGFDVGEQPKYLAMLKVPPINDPADAVRAAIVSGNFR